MITKPKSIFTLAIILFSLILISVSVNAAVGCGGEGLLRITAKGPFGVILNSEELRYSNAMSYGDNPQISFTSYCYPEEHIFSYDDFNYLSSESGSGDVYPYCAMGGKYSYDIYNNPHIGSREYKQNLTLYYCKTTKDLIDMVKVPLDWQDANIIMYCNDGNLINFDTNINLDFLTTKINNYKICVIKNIDLTTNNTFVYGLEVGNVEVDDDPKYFFNPEINKSRITHSLDYISQISNYNSNFAISLTKYFPYVQRCTTTNTYDDNLVESDPNYVETTEQCSMGPVTEEEARTQLEDIHEGYTVSDVTIDTEFESRYASIGTGRTRSSIFSGITRSNIIGLNSNSLQFTKINYKVTMNSNINVMEYEDDKGKFYVFTYLPGLSLFSLNDLGYSDFLNSMPISDIFNSEEYSDMGISRMALFRSIKDALPVYGYESVDLIDSADLRPVYKITTSNPQFTTDDCLSMLAGYNANSDTQEESYTVFCDPNGGDILINSANIDDTYDKQGMGFNLFKNIILSIRY